MLFLEISSLLIDHIDFMLSQYKFNDLKSFWVFFGIVASVFERHIKIHYCTVGVTTLCSWLIGAKSYSHMAL